MTEDERDRSGAEPVPAAEPVENEEDTDDTEGQALTWKVRKPIPAVQDDVEGQSVRPSPKQAGLTMPAIADDEDDAEGHGGITGSSRPPVD